MTALADLQALLLDLLPAGRPVEASRLAGLDDDDWTQVLAMAGEHRLAPLLHWRLSHEHKDLPVPDSIRAQLAGAFRAATMRALIHQRELVVTHRLLDAAGIPNVALKGAYLAFHSYPHPALRPMRDLDILVPADQVMRAYQVLIDGGCSKTAFGDSDPLAWMVVYKHLPPLVSPSGQISVELHIRLISPDILPQNASDPFDEAIWTRLVSQAAGTETFHFLSPTDLLLHLIIHATYDHRFDNGPLLLSDLAYLMGAQAIDWPLFWDLARRSGTARGCVLALKMTERYWSIPAIAYPPDLLDVDGAALDRYVDAASLSTLQSTTAIKETRVDTVLAGSASPREKLAYFLGRLFPSRALIASNYPVAYDSPRIYFWYVVRWYRLAVTRLPRHLANRKRTQASVEVAQISQVVNWLYGGRAPQ